MTREELLKIAKPVLFNTEMVQAILEGRKTVTRRLVKPQPDEKHNFPLGFVIDSTNKKDIGKFAFGIDEFGGSHQYAKPPFKKGDYLYVRETWCWCPCWDCAMDSEEGCCDKNAEKFYHSERHEYGCYGYRASFVANEEPFERWYPSIHMPKEAARIFLKVTDVRVERLQDMVKEDFEKEGVIDICNGCGTPRDFCDCCGGLEEEFIELWDSTIKTVDLDKYGWEANPWVWVIEFDRVEV